MVIVLVLVPVRVHMHTQLYIYTYMHTYKNTIVHAHMYIQKHTYLHKYLCVYEDVMKLQRANPAAGCRTKLLKITQGQPLIFADRLLVQLLDIQTNVASFSGLGSCSWSSNPLWL